MARKKKEKFVSKYADDATIINTKVLEIEEQNVQYYDEKKNKYRFKSVFYCASSRGKPRMCVSWDRNTIQVGDEVQLKGRLNDDVFLVWSLLIMRRSSDV